MKKLIICFLSLAFAVLPIQAQSSSNTVDSTPEVSNIPTTPVKEHGGGPLDPSQYPLTCTLMGDCLSVVCAYDVMGEVTVVNNYTLETVASESGNLGEGIILTLDNYTRGAMTLTVTISDTTYVGNF